MSLRSSGRTKTSNDKSEAIGLPGNTNIGIESGPITPKPCAPPGVMFTRVIST